MASLVSLIFILAISILVTKIATQALVHTGLSKTSAKFQARSAFTGVGYTTDESEKITGHPVRRKIILVLMLLGNVGVVSVLASLILTFVDESLGIDQWIFRLGILIGGVAILWILANSDMVDRWLSRLISRLLNKYTDLDVRDYEGILHLQGDYEITEMKVDDDNWMEGQNLGELQLRDEGVNIIGIERENGNYIGLPKGETEIKIGDSLVIYGRAQAIKKLNERPKGYTGKVDHHKAVKEQDQINKEERDEEKTDQKEKKIKEKAE